MKILLADDHILFRAGLVHIVCEADPSMEIIEASSCAQMRSAIAANPDLGLALVDIHMPDGNGLDVLLEGHDTLPVVVLSGSESYDDMQRALRAGARGFMPKTITASVMMCALRVVLAGGIYVPPEMMRMEAVAAQNTSDPSGLGLTPRQLDVLALLIKGKTNKSIAKELGIAETTVTAHLTEVFRVLKVNNRTEAARAATMLNQRRIA